jgi:hypothetical protein
MKTLIVTVILLASSMVTCFAQDTIKSAKPSKLKSIHQVDSVKAPNNWFQREKYIALNAQPTWLRIIKFPVFLIVGFLLFRWKGWRAVLFMILFLIIFGIAFHFFLRHMTDGWTKEWWFVQKITTPYD